MKRASVFLSHTGNPKSNWDDAAYTVIAPPGVCCRCNKGQSVHDQDRDVDLDADSPTQKVLMTRGDCNEPSKRDHIRYRAEHVQRNLQTVVLCVEKTMLLNTTNNP